ncbi:MAG: pyruvate, phosphate dikinase [Candidatus Fermentithermobacillus carboniphilus]|uniref:Pyruvate, phosphate dikinase n=1 Tax=Candidatus Fermentithermobacillus carboniphilus TaxID=3085328 RepID=A0AAT9LGX0_9FIRM|nr:MAG: pyruvate, phosphate dikinase [Candidatus Fermentithermobacillus carboniphilus]
MATKLIYWFREGGEDKRALLGGKGAGLAEMTRIGLPVPPGFTITTEACKMYYSLGEKLPPGLEEDIKCYMSGLEKETGKVFGGRHNPLLVSVRSGAPISMPGMMDTILNLGLNDETVMGLYEATGDERFSYDCYRRFIQMFGNVVLGIPHDEFERALSRLKSEEGARLDYEISPDGLKTLVKRYKDIIREKAGVDFPENPYDQLMMAVSAVFRSWNNQRAVIYRKINKIPDDLGTAVNVQTMVFGNMGFDSATGVMFTRNPSTGEKVLYGEYLVNAQGEDVVAGLRTPKPIAEMADELPDAHRELTRIAELLENHYRDMQDIEFTVERGKVYILQTRTGKRTALASLEIARQMVHEGKISKKEAVGRVKPEEVARLLHRGIDPGAKNEVLAQGLPASPGAASGALVFDSDTAEALGQKGEKVILVRPETTPDDMPGIVYSQGILTSRGGMTCHAAIVARGMGKPAVVGCEALKIDLEGRKAYVGNVVLKEGDVVSIDGATGKVYLGQVPLVEPSMGDAFKEILSWADEIRRLGVKANADTPEDARRAREFGAEGIGLCRTEHMFMAADRLPVVQEMIMAQTTEERRRALDKLLPMQEGDFYEILKAMRGYPVTIRLLDPPLHEFLPNVEELLVRLSEMRHAGAPEAEISKVEEILRKARTLQEMNPMLGMRGCRLGIVYPEIYEMQARAIFQATARLIKDGYRDVEPEVMIPLVGEARELSILRDLVVKVGEEVKQREGVDFQVVVGTMIEIPRAALTADEIAEYAEFFSFGTNDLTQTTFGFSRDDAEAKFLHKYLADKILKENPFAVLDQKGVGKLVQMAVELGRKTRPGLVIGICGEHGGDPESIKFCHRAGLDYVSCSPFRVPVARLAAAHAALEA